MDNQTPTYNNNSVIAKNNLHKIINAIGSYIEEVFTTDEMDLLTELPEEDQCKLQNWSVDKYIKYANIGGYFELNDIECFDFDFDDYE